MHSEVQPCVGLTEDVRSLEEAPCAGELFQAPASPARRSSSSKNSASPRGMAATSSGAAAEREAGARGHRLDHAELDQPLDRRP